MSLIICKKCGGPHITIKCGKESKIIEPVVEIPKETTFKKHDGNDNYKKYDSNKHDNYKKHDNYNKYDTSKRKIVTIKLSNLPYDMTVQELELLVKPWGHIGRVNLNNSENKAGFIDFNFKEESDYFIEAIDRTPFDNVIIRAEYIENKY